MRIYIVYDKEYDSDSASESRQRQREYRAETYRRNMEASENATRKRESEEEDRRERRESASDLRYSYEKQREGGYGNDNTRDTRSDDRAFQEFGKPMALIREERRMRANEEKFNNILRKLGIRREDL